MLGVLFAGKDQQGKDDILYLGINTYWEPIEVELPSLPQEFYWVPIADTSRGAEAIIRQKEVLCQNRYLLQSRSVCLFQVKS